MIVLGVVTVMLENGILAVSSAVHISIFIRLCKNIAISLPIFKDIIPTNTLAYPSKVITPDNGTAIKLDSMNTVDMLLKFNTVIGSTTICADIVTDKISAILLFIYFFKNFDIGLFK